VKEKYLKKVKKERKKSSRTRKKGKFFYGVFAIYFSVLLEVRARAYSLVSLTAAARTTHGDCHTSHSLMRKKVNE
jgi:hypothetical protein